MSVGLVALAALAGWLLAIPGLTSLYLPGPTLKTNAAVCLLCAAAANLALTFVPRRSRWRLLVYSVAAIPPTIGALTLSEHLFGWDLRIDQLIATEAPGALATMSPNRMGPPASSANLLLGLALLWRDSQSPRRRALGQLLACLTCLIAVLPLMGYANGFTELYSVAQYTGISLVNAAALLTMGVAVQAGRPDGGLAALVCRHDEVGVFARRMLLAAILLPFGIGWMLAQTINLRMIDPPFAISVMALVLIVTLALVIWSTGTRLVRSLDIRTASEQALAESERTLREADQQKTEFLATLSHELRNPLAPIRFATELLDGPPPVAQRARLTIRRQVHHLTRLIDDLLDLTRITRNRVELHFRSSDLRQLVADAVDGVSAEVDNRRLKLSIDLPPHPLWLQVDAERVVQMLVNLLANAVRHSDPGGTIWIGYTAEDDFVTVSVRDEGHGIDAADLGRVFERFVQVGKTHHGGLGIGLALVKTLAELHGGTVEARSEGLGMGSEFLVRLPRAVAPEPTAVLPRSSDTASCRILVVDDNRDAADMLAELLTVVGHRVVVAYDGEEALRNARAFEPQVALLDIGMAGMDGYELAARLRADSDVPTLFLVAITGWGQEDDRRRALAAGFDAHLTKPPDLDEITALLASRFPAQVDHEHSARI